MAIPPNNAALKGAVIGKDEKDTSKWEHRC